MLNFKSPLKWTHSPCWSYCTATVAKIGWWYVNQLMRQRFSSISTYWEMRGNLHVTCVMLCCAKCLHPIQFLVIFGSIWVIYLNLTFLLFHCQTCRLHKLNISEVTKLWNLFLAPAAAKKTELLYYTWHTSCKANCKSFLPDFFLCTIVLLHEEKNWRRRSKLIYN